MPAARAVSFSAQLQDSSSAAQNLSFDKTGRDNVA
jgi:hypothetical protein